MLLDRLRTRAVVVDKPWEELNGEPACPLVIAPQLLSASDALGFLDPYLPGPQVELQDEDGYWLKSMPRGCT